MNIIIDSNVLFSALISESTTRKLILEYNGFFLLPKFVLEETDEHKEELIRKSEMSNEDFNKLFHILLNKVLIVPDETLYPHREEALKIIGDIDIDDVIFVACALAYPNSHIWSDDKKLKNQTRVKILNTKEIIKIFYG